MYNVEIRKSVELLHAAILSGENAEGALWQTIIDYQNYPFFTSSGLRFSYIVKRRKNGEYSGELLISRKEDSKTLTKSSVMLAFRRVLDRIESRETADSEDFSSEALIPPEYKGPKAIGQIFGISYVYSIFWSFGLIKVPDKVERMLQGTGASSEKQSEQYAG